MRHLVCLGVAALFLAACNQPAQQQASTDTATHDAGVPVDSPTVQAAAPASYNPDFPTGFQPPFTYSIRSRKADGQVRKLVIEFKQGDAPTVDKQIEELLAAKGYKRYKTLKRGEELVGDYGSNGRRITVTTTPADGKLQLAADSLGTVYFVWKE